MNYITNDEAIATAVKYMRDKGWYVRHSQWEYDHRHIDLICIDSNMSMIAFVEVTNNGRMVSPSLDDIITTAAIYVREYHVENIPVRFDRISINTLSDGSMSIKHIENTRKTIDPYTFYEQMRDRQRVQNMFVNKPINS